MRARSNGLFGVHEGMDEMRARNIPTNVFTYFLLREIAILEGDKATAENALHKIKELIQGYRQKDKGMDWHETSNLPNEEELDMVSVPKYLLPLDTQVTHWKGYYASDEDDW